MDIETLGRWADEELKSLLAALPEEIRAAAKSVPVSFETTPGQGAFDDQLAGDELGLFEGHTAAEEPDPANLPKIRLFLESLWQWVEGDEQDFRDEVGITYLHELGHYLGWDEDEIADRGLD